MQYLVPGSTRYQVPGTRYNSNVLSMQVAVDGTELLSDVPYVLPIFCGGSYYRYTPTHGSSTPSTDVVSRSSASHDFLTCHLPGRYSENYTMVPEYHRPCTWYQYRYEGYLVLRYQAVSCTGSKRELNTCVAIFARCGLGSAMFYVVIMSSFLPVPPRRGNTG